MTATLHPRRLTAPTATRLVAAAIDLTIVVLPPLTVTLVTSQGQNIDASRWSPTGLALTAAALVVTAFAVYVGFPTLGDGRSPGKGATGLRVVADDGQRASGSQHLVRAITGPCDLVAAPLLGLGAAAAGRTDPTRRRPGDRLAGTRVIRSPRDWVVAPGPPPIDSAPPAAEPDLTPTPIPTLDLEGQPVEITLPETEPVPGAQASTGLGEAAPKTMVADRTPRSASPAPAPPLLPVRRLDGSPTRSPLARTGATRADMAPDNRAASPDAGWLGGPLDLDECSLGRDETAGHQPNSRMLTPGFDALVLPESSLAEGSSSLTRAERDRQRSLPEPSSPNCS